MRSVCAPLGRATARQASSSRISRGTLTTARPPIHVVETESQGEAGHDTTDSWWNLSLQLLVGSTMTRLSSRYLSAMALTILIALAAGAQSIVGKDKTGPVPQPVNRDTSGKIQAKSASVRDDMVIAGQPTEQALG